MSAKLLDMKLIVGMCPSRYWFYNPLYLLGGRFGSEWVKEGAHD